jgi:GAF domain-containing protein
VLDTPPEEDFDQIAALAADVCETPIAFLTLIDGRRRWLKAKVGFFVAELPREISFCSHAIAQDDLFQVTDATGDEGFRENPLVTGTPGIRFYAGVPLRVDSGFRLGTLCVLGTVPRQLTAVQRKKLTILAQHVSYKLDFRLLQFKVETDLAVTRGAKQH